MHCCDRNGVLPWNPPVPETKWKSNFRRKMMNSSKSYSSPLLAWTGLRKTFNTNKTCKTSSVARVQIVAHQNRKSPLEINPSKKIGKKKSLKPWCLTCSNCRRGRILWSSIFQSILVPYIQLPGHFGLIDKTDKSNHSKWWFHQETNKTPAVISMAPKNSARSFWHIFRKKHLPVTGATDAHLALWSRAKLGVNPRGDHEAFTGLQKYILPWNRPLECFSEWLKKIRRIAWKCNSTSKKLDN